MDGGVNLVFKCRRESQLTTSVTALRSRKRSCFISREAKHVSRLIFREGKGGRDER